MILRCLDEWLPLIPGIHELASGELLCSRSMALEVIFVEYRSMTPAKSSKLIVIHPLAVDANAMQHIQAPMQALSAEC
jgi:hypothetical protein